MLSILVTLLVLKPDTLRLVRESQEKNIPDMSVTFAVLNVERSRLFRLGQ